MTDKVYTIVEIIACSHALMGGIMQFFKSADNIGSYKTALVVGSSVFKVIERIPEIRDDPNV
jgi:ABC-type multidrug transport system fused ATPase/permease subunit